MSILSLDIYPPSYPSFGLAAVEVPDMVAADDVLVSQRRELQWGPPKWDHEETKCDGTPCFEIKHEHGHKIMKRGIKCTSLIKIFWGKFMLPYFLIYFTKDTANSDYILTKDIAFLQFSSGGINSHYNIRCQYLSERSQV
jgi:hypothetical protein